MTSFAVRSVRLFFYPPAAPCRGCTAGIASDALRPTLSAAAETIEPIIAAATDAIASELHASREEMDGSSVPQYAAAIEAAGSLGQTLKSHFAQSGAGLDGVLTLTAALAHAHEEDMAVYRANVSRDPNRAVSIPRLQQSSNPHDVPTRQGSPGGPELQPRRRSHTQLATTRI